MKAKHAESLMRLNKEILELSKELPTGKRNQVINRCNAMNITIKKAFKTVSPAVETSAPAAKTEPNLAEQRQIADRYIAKKAIFDAMTKGRKVSFLDSREFEVSEFHTQICAIRQDIEDKQLPWVLNDRWITFGKHGKRCKEYWLESKNQ